MSLETDLLEKINTLAKLTEQVGIIRSEIEHDIKLVMLIKNTDKESITSKPIELKRISPNSIRRKFPTSQTRREFILKWGESHETFSPAEIAQAASSKLTSIRAVFSILKAEDLIIPVGNTHYKLKENIKKLA